MHISLETFRALERIRAHATHNIFPTLRYTNCVLEAVCDLNRTAAECNARHFGAPAVYTDYEKMLDEIKPDGVLAVGPPFLHYEAAKAALARAIPVFTEKPPAPDLKSVKELVALARQHGTFLMPGYMKRHGLTYRKARELMQSGAFEPATVRHFLAIKSRDSCPNQIRVRETRSAG